jgi:hypothetical protein
VKYIDLSECEGVTAWEGPPPRRRTAGRSLNAGTLAERFKRTALAVQFGVPDPANVQMLRATFARWNRQGVEYEVIAKAQDLFFEGFPAGMRAPAGHVFVKNGAGWIAEAREHLRPSWTPGGISWRRLPRRKRS